MRKIKNVITSLMLCIAIALSFSSCEYIDAIINKDGNNSDSNTNVVHSCPACQTTKDGYTGGYSRYQEFHNKYGVYWLETYDEVLEAVELLKSHDSIINTGLGFNYESELIDSKFCFKFKKTDAEPLEEGKNFFDRKIDNGEFGWFGFFDDITIEELIYDHIIYDFNIICFTDVFRDVSSRETNYEIVGSIDDTAQLSFDWFGKSYGYTTPPEPFYEVCYIGESFAMLEFRKNFISEEYHREFLDAFVVIS